MNEYYDEVPFSYGDNVPRSTEDEFFGSGWSVRRSDGRWFFSFISGSLMGKGVEVEISETDFELAKTGKISFDQLCIKYDVS